MADENLDAWKVTPAIINKTVYATKEFLDGELDKADNLECLNKNIRALFSGIKGDFYHCKKNGIGQTTILKFLGGNGNSG